MYIRKILHADFYAEPSGQVSSLMQKVNDELAAAGRDTNGHPNARVRWIAHQVGAPGSRIIAIIEDTSR